MSQFTGNGSKERKGLIAATLNTLADGKERTRLTALGSYVETNSSHEIEVKTRWDDNWKTTIKHSRRFKLNKAG